MEDVEEGCDELCENVDLLDKDLFLDRWLVKAMLTGKSVDGALIIVSKNVVKQSVAIDGLG